MSILKSLNWLCGKDNSEDSDDFYFDEKKFLNSSRPEKPQEVILKESSFNANKIIEYKGDKLKKFEFRPQTWNQFVGQTEAKERAKTIIQKARMGMKAHFLVDGIKGHGKTTFVELLAKDMGAKIIKRIGKQIDEENLVDIINEINTSQEQFVMFFVDEIDTMDWKVIKVLNPIIESFEITGKRIKPFIFAGATINKHILIKNNPDTLDRIAHHIKFARYNVGEIANILSQYHKQLYSNTKLPSEVLITISKNCKFNPRSAIALLEDYIVEHDIEKVLQNCNIIKDGLTTLDIKLLSVLNKSTRAIGANALALKCGLSQNEYIREFEPFLCEFGYLNRIPSRIITKKGKELLEELKNVKLL